MNYPPMFDKTLIFIPAAMELIRSNGSLIRNYRTLYIFGVRVFIWVVG